MHRQEGFTLIELMIVILIIGILVGIAVPVFLAARSNANEKACLSNQRNFMSAADIYAAENEVYPTAVGGGWPENYYDGDLDQGGAPVCPAGGIITVTYGDTEDRPETTCDQHGAP